MEVRRPLSSICRGTGTWSGNVLTTPLPIPTINHIEPYHESMHKKTVKLPNISIPGNTLPKTFATRHGALLLFADTYKVWRKQLTEKDIDSQEDENEKVAQQLKTLKELRSLVLSFGLDDDSVIKRISAILHDDSLIQVRPGYSPNRYTSSAVRLWDPQLVDKYLENDGINKSVVQKYFELLLPDVTVNGIVLKDTLLGSRPHKYNSFKLPKINTEKNKETNTEEMDRQKVDIRKKTNVMVLPKIDFTSVSYLPKNLLERHESQKHNLKKKLMDPNQKKFWNNYENLTYDEKADLLFRMLVSRKQDDSEEINDNNNNNNNTESVKNEKTQNRKCIFPDLTNTNPNTNHPLQVNPVTYNQKENNHPSELPHIINPSIIKSPSKTTKGVTKPTDSNKKQSLGIPPGCLPNDVEPTERVELPKFIYRPSKLTSYGVSQCDPCHNHHNEKSAGLMVLGTAFSKSDDNFTFGHTDQQDSRRSSLPSFASMSCSGDFKNYENIAGRYMNNYSPVNNIVPLHYTTITTPYLLNNNNIIAAKNAPHLLRNNYFASVESVESSIADDLERVDSADLKMNYHTLPKLPSRDLNGSTTSSSNNKQSNIDMDVSSRHSAPRRINGGSVDSSVKKKNYQSSSSNTSARSSITLTNEIRGSESGKSSPENVSLKDDDGSYASSKRENENDDTVSVSSIKKPDSADTSKVHEEELPSVSMVTNDVISNVENIGDDPSGGSVEGDTVNDDVPTMLPESITIEEFQPVPPRTPTSSPTNNDIMGTNEVRSLETSTVQTDGSGLQTDGIQDTSECLPLNVEAEIVTDTVTHEDDTQDVSDGLLVTDDMQNEVILRDSSVSSVLSDAIGKMEDTSYGNAKAEESTKDEKVSDGSVTIIVDGGSEGYDDKDNKMSDDLSNEEELRPPPQYQDEDSDDVRYESDSYLSTSTLKNSISGSFDEDVGGTKSPMEVRLNVIIQEVLSRPESGIDINKDISAAEEAYKAEVLKQMESDVEEEEEEKEEKEEKEGKVTPEKTFIIPANVVQVNGQSKDDVKDDVVLKVDVADNTIPVPDEKEKVIVPKPEPFRVGTSMDEKPKYLESQPKKTNKKITQTKKKSTDKKGKETKKVSKKVKTPPPPKPPSVNDIKNLPDLTENQNLEAELKAQSPSLETEEALQPQLTDSQQLTPVPRIATPFPPAKSPSLKSLSGKSSSGRSSSTEEYRIRRSPEEPVKVKEASPVVSEQKAVVKNDVDVEKERVALVKKEKREKSAAERRADVEKKRKLLEEKRRLEKEEKLRETELYLQKVQEEEQRNQQRQMEMEDELRRQEDNKKRALQMEKERVEAEEMEKRRKQEEGEKLKKKKIADEEAQRKKMEILMAERQMELDFKRAQEEMARAIEADMAEKERLLMEQMAEEERRLYEERKRLEEELRAREDEERAKLLEIKRKEEEKKREKELEDLLRLEAKQLFTCSARRTNRLLEIQQQVSRAYTYSYFNLLPIIFYGASNPSLKKRARKVPNLTNVLDKLEDVPDQ